TLAVALTRGRIQLRDLTNIALARNANTSSGSNAPRKKREWPASNVPIITADWVAHQGLVTCMAARPMKGVHRDGTGTVLGVGSAYSGGSGNFFTGVGTPALATGGGDGKVKVWTEEGGMGSSKGDLGHEGAVLGVCWHPGGEMLASCGQDSSVWLWGMTGNVLGVVDTLHRWTVAVAFSCSGNRLMACGHERFEGWTIPLRHNSTGASLAWRQPLQLTAARTKIAGAVGLSKEASEILNDHGAIEWTSATSAASAARLASQGTQGAEVAQVATAWGYVPALAELHSTAGGAAFLSGSDACGRTPLHTAILSRGAGPAAVGSGNVGSKSAFWGGNEQSEGALLAAKFLVEIGGVDIEARDEEGMTPLALAARHGRGRMVEALLRAGANMEAVDVRGYTPACWAAAGGYSTILRALLFAAADGYLVGKDRHQSAGADPDHMAEGCDTPAILAARGGHLSALAMLEDAGADLDKPNSKGTTPLITASREGHSAALAFLAGLSGIDVNRRDSSDGMTALAAATFQGHTACVRVLISRGANPLLNTLDGRTPTYLAASQGHLPALRSLLEAFGPGKAKEARRRDAGGCTPIMLAAANGHLDCLVVLNQSDGTGAAMVGRDQKHGRNRGFDPGGGG
ncbi:unnamed protein product, partial [Choristocarpus tenellus]